MTASEISLPRSWPLALGVAGLIPFVAGAAGVWLVGDTATAARVGFALAAYAATITSFLGGIHWGLALKSGRHAPAQFVWGVIPQLAGWGSLLLPHPANLWACAGVLVACYIADRRFYADAGLSRWLPLRAGLSAVAALSCVVAAL